MFFTKKEKYRQKISPTELFIIRLQFFTRMDIFFNVIMCIFRNPDNNAVQHFLTIFDACRQKM